MLVALQMVLFQGIRRERSRRNKLTLLNWRVLQQLRSGQIALGIDRFVWFCGVCVVAHGCLYGMFVE